VLSFLAYVSAASSSKVASISTAGLGSPIRPIALSRGAIEKPMVVSSASFIETPLSLNKACKPIRSVSLIVSNPKATSVRFSPVIDTKSAIVPIATKSKNSAGGSSNNAVATLKATPTPARSGNG